MSQLLDGLRTAIPDRKFSNPDELEELAKTISQLVVSWIITRDPPASRDPASQASARAGVSVPDAIGRYCTYLNTLGRALGTIRSLRSTAAKWTEWEPRGIKPLLHQVKRSDLVAFRAFILAGGAGNKTANNHISRLRAVLRWSAEEEIIGRVPLMPRPLPWEPPGNLVIPREHVAAIYKAAAAATWPRCHVAAPTLWRVLLVLWWHYGFDTQMLYAHDADKIGLLGANFFRGRECPDPNVQLDCPHGWLQFVRQKTKGSKITPIVLPLTVLTRRAVDLVAAGAAGDRPLIGNVPRGNKHFYKQWHAIVDRAGVRPKDCPVKGPRRYLPKHLRKSAAEALNSVTAGVGNYVLGHTQRGMTAKHYDQPLYRVARAYELLEPPPEFESLLTEEFSVKAKFPLWLFKDRGVWCKKIGGRLYSFGADRKQALERYLREKDAIERGLK